MMRSWVYLWLVCSLAMAAVPSLAGAMTIQVGDAGATFIGLGEMWRFQRGVAAPSDAWMAVDFNDSLWETGPAGFGYADDDDATVLDDMQGNYVTVYTRKVFSVSSLGSEMLELTVDYDDGFIAYLNGQEVARRSMPEGPAIYTTRASSHEAGSPETIVLGKVIDLLVRGTNVLAIEGHNVSTTSSDFSLNATLRTASDTLRAGDAWIVTTQTVTLSGRIKVRHAVTVEVAGIEIDFDATGGTWTYTLWLPVGLNTVAVVAFDANGNEIDSASAEIVYAPPENHLSGELTADAVLSGVWVLDDTVTVPAEVVLMIEPGTAILMQDGVSLVVYGQLLAQGTETRPIRWTQYGAGAAWKQILFVDANDSRFDHCLFEYADSEGAHQDYYEEGPRDYHEAIVALACHIDVNDCVFQNLPDGSGGAEGDAIAIISDDPNHPGDATANVTGCQFLGIGQGVHTRYAYVLVENCFFTGKRGDNDDVDLWGESTPPPLIRNNVFLNPEHDDMINPTNCSAVLIGNFIVGSDDHGVVLRGRSFPVMINNVIYDCSSAGIAVENSCEALLINNTIVDCGRGLRLFDLGRWGPPYRLSPGGGTATVVNCIIWDCPQPITLNDSSNTDIEDRGSHLTVLYSDIEGGQDGISVSGGQSTVIWGAGNIDADPLFTDPQQGDLHLRSEFGRWDPNEPGWVIDDVTSPCLDAGDPNEPVGNEPLPHGNRINIGAYGGTIEASKSPNSSPAP